MLTELTMTLDTPIEYYQSSNLQGILMSNISTKYAEYLHNQPFNPYSMAVYQKNKKTIWRVATLTQEAYDNIIVPLSSDNFKEFDIFKHDLHTKIIDKNIISLSDRDLANKSFNENNEYYTLNYRTPTSFKSNNKYIFIPDLRLIYQSLINKYNYVYNGKREDNTDLINDMVNATYITKCDIKSKKFPLEGRTIIGCVGNIGIRITGDEYIKKMIRMLLYFGEYSGLGIKSSIGMGNITITPT